MMNTKSSKPVGLLLIMAILLSAIGCVETPESTTYWPTEGWNNSTPEKHGFDSAKLAEALLTMREQNINIHSLLIIRDGEVLLDAYFYPYDGTTVHDQASVTKSVMTTLIAIADEEDKLQLDQPMVSFFPERNIQNLDVRKENITVRHLASMSSGLACTSERDEETLNEMMASPDWIQFTLDRKMMWEPSTHFVYCSPGMHLLSAILQNATGMTALEYARLNLFEPLGIHNVIWYTDPQGYNMGSADLYLHPHDMAKIGYMWLNKGQWDGKQIVSSEWVEDSVKVQMVTGGNDNYGYGWWVPQDEPMSYSAIGRGGQRILVVPDWDLIVVTTGGGFDFDEIEPLLLPTIVDLDSELPANPAGMAQLDAAMDIIAQSPTPLPVEPLPEMAREISSKNFTFDPNPLEVEKMRLEFNDSDEAIAYLMFTEEEQMLRWSVGLDSVYRLSPGDNGFPLGLRGYWADEQTFVMEYDEIANNGYIILRMRFEGNRVVVEGQEAAHELRIRFEGVQEKT